MIYNLQLVCRIPENQDRCDPANDLGFVVNYFFDDTEVATLPEKYVGLSLNSHQEAVAIERFGALLDEYVNKYSPHDEPIKFVEGTDWESIQNSAISALDVILDGKTY